MGGEKGDGKGKGFGGVQGFHSVGVPGQNGPESSETINVAVFP